MLRQHAEVPRCAVLDLAAGTGALLARLRDIGFADLSAVELELPVFQLSGVTPAAIDLNSDFSASYQRRFGLLTAVEIMEHLDSPRHFLRQIWNLLEPGGYLVVSTPNVVQWVSRIWFLLRGELRYFRESDYHHQRHISPVNPTHIRLILKEIGFDIVECRTAGSFYGPLKRWATAPIAGFFRLIQGPLATGDVVIYLARKTCPDNASPGRSSDVYVNRHRAPAQAVAAGGSKVMAEA